MQTFLKTKAKYSLASLVVVVVLWATNSQVLMLSDAVKLTKG